MDFLFGGLININIFLILKLMVFEFLMGAVVGGCKKEVARLQARLAPTKRIIPANEYTSTVFGENLPRGAFNLLALSPEFVVVDYNEDEVKSEIFYSPLGEHISIVDGRGTLIGSSVLSSPIYLCTVVFPLLLGFIASVFLFWLSPINEYAPAYLISGLAWCMVAPWLPILIYSIKTGGNPSE